MNDAGVGDAGVDAAGGDAAGTSAMQQPADGELGPGDHKAPALAGFTLLGDDAAPGCVGDECAIPAPPAPKA